MSKQGKIFVGIVAVIAIAVAIMILGTGGHVIGQ